MNIIKGKIKTAPKIVIYGLEGVGKSTLAGKAPNPLFIDLEGGSNHLDTDRTTPKNWAEAVKTAEAAATSSYSTIVLDTADWAERMCNDHVCARDKKSNIEDYGYGKGYGIAALEYVKLLGALDKCRDNGKTVIMLAHSQIKKFERPDESGSYDRFELKCSKMVSPIVKEWCDALLFADYKTIVQESATGKAKGIGGKERVLRCSHSAAWDAKNRFGLNDEEPMDIGVLLPHLGAPPKEPPPPKIDKLAELMTAEGITTEEMDSYLKAKGWKDLRELKDSFKELMVKPENWVKIVSTIKGDVL